MATKVIRRELLNQATKIIEESERQKRTQESIAWREIGSIERQCDYLRKLISELTNDL